MDFYNDGKITRRNFIKGVAGAAVCCACLSPEYLTASEDDKIMNGMGKEHLAAACGTYCGACPAYIVNHIRDEQIKKKLQERSASRSTKAPEGIPPSNWMHGLYCDGCLSGGKLAPHCQNCAIRKCAANKQNNSRCSDCEELPCYRITNLIHMGNYLHRKEYLPNLKKIREMGIQEWVKYEKDRWRCPRCGVPLSWYDAECVGCGEPRSGRLFPLPAGL